MAVLETERLTLRPLTGDDFDDYAAMMADPQVADGLADPIGRTPADAWRNLALFIGHREIRGYSHWAVVERATGHFVGRAGPWQPHGFPGLGVGWCLARAHWGKGYATEAARAALTYCFTTLNADEVISVIRPGNTSAAELCQAKHLAMPRLDAGCLRGRCDSGDLPLGWYSVPVPIVVGGLLWRVRWVSRGIAESSLIRSRRSRRTR